MKNQWMGKLTGIVKVKISGPGIERFINSLTRAGILIWNVRMHGSETSTFELKLQDAKKLRAYVKKSDCKIKFIGRAGGPFFLRKLWTNLGFVLGAGAFLLLLFFLSNMVWGIEIKGASPAVEHKIRKELNEMGVKIGQPQFRLSNVDLLQRDLTDRVEELTWVGVELRGTTYHFQVVEKKEPEKTEEIGNQHLASSKKATIVKMFIEEGEALVQLNDVVHPGQLLVSGLIGKEGEKKPVAARGEIWGETWYLNTVELPLTTRLKVYTGEEKRKFYLRIGKTDVPVWGFGKHEYKEYETEDSPYRLKFWKWELPVSFVERTIREEEQAERTYTVVEARKDAMEIARQAIKKQIPEDAKIQGEEILHQSLNNGKVRLSIHFQIIENIVVGQPIIQGE